MTTYLDPTDVFRAALYEVGARQPTHVWTEDVDGTPAILWTRNGIGVSLVHRRAALLASFAIGWQNATTPCDPCWVAADGVASWSTCRTFTKAEVIAGARCEP